MVICSDMCSCSCITMCVEISVVICSDMCMCSCITMCVEIG